MLQDVKHELTEECYIVTIKWRVLASVFQSQYLPTLLDPIHFPYTQWVGLSKGTGHFCLIDRTTHRGLRMYTAFRAS